VSLHYIIDGYNVIHKVDGLIDRKIEDCRQGLLKLIEIYRPQGSLRNNVTVVFDGTIDISNPPKSGSVRVIFSEHKTADDKIKKLVECSSNPRHIVVVSDDKEIIYYCRSLGAQIKSVKDFLSFLKKRNISKNRKTDTQAKDKPSLDSELAKQITADLKDIWLK